MTTFVDTSVLLSGTEASDQDPVVVVVRSAHGMLREGLGESESGKFQQEFANQYSEKNFSNIFDLLLGNTHVIFKRLAAEEGNVESVARISKTAEGYFDVVLSILSKLESVEEVIERIQLFIKAIVDSEPKSVASVQALKLRLLKTLLTVLSPRVQLRLTVVAGLCRFGQENPKFKSAVFKLVGETAKWIDEFDWEVSDDEKFDLFGQIVSVAESLDRIDYMRKQLTVAPEVKKGPLAHAVEIEALNHPSFFDFESIKNSTDANIAKIVEIFLSGDLQDMRNFTTKIDKIDMTILVDKMRVVSIQAMAENKRQLPIDQISAQIGIADPFSVIVKAMQAGLVKGSINGVDGIVEITAVKPRSRSTRVATLGKLGKIQQAYRSHE